ncbi:MAG: hypothetical protein FWF31_01215 [Desulfobulbus sp.]|nr:hypothetical protein [Desulfobulbus sp.]
MELITGIITSRRAASVWGWSAFCRIAASRLDRPSAGSTMSPSKAHPERNTPHRQKKSTSSLHDENLEGTMDVVHYRKVESDETKKEIPVVPALGMPDFFAHGPLARNG